MTAASGPPLDPAAPGGADVVSDDELQVAPTSDAAARARRFVRHYCDQQDVPDLVDDVQLVVSELVTNAVVHARTRIRVRIERLPTGIKLTVHDRAAHRPVPTLAGSVLDDAEHGRGLLIVDACTAEWGAGVTSEEGKSTWALFALSASPTECPTAAA